MSAHAHAHTSTHTLLAHLNPFSFVLKRQRWPSEPLIHPLVSLLKSHLLNYRLYLLMNSQLKHSASTKPPPTPAPSRRRPQPVSADDWVVIPSRLAPLSRVFMRPVCTPSPRLQRLCNAESESLFFFSSLPSDAADT